MIQVAPNRNQNGMIALAVLGVVAIVFLATYRSQPAAPAATAGPSDVAVATSSASPSPTPTPRRSQGPTPTPSPTLPPCELPTSLPTDATSAAVPKVTGRVGSILFASPVYRAAKPNVVAQDRPADFNMGLWFVPAPGAEPSLVTAAGPGMVIPLALSPNGEEAAVWWWPRRHGFTVDRCQQGIYAIDLTNGGASRLIAHGDWSITDQDSEGPNLTWVDPTQTTSVPLAFRMPRASFSSDGSLLALASGTDIDIYRTAFPADAVHHVGSCPQFGWAPNESRFVAACEDMTSAWLVYLVCCDAGIESTSIPIPKPPIDTFFAGWESTTIRAIGFDAHGDIRIVRTYGYATGCEGQGPCNLPSPAWAVTTIDRDTQAVTQGGAEYNTLFDTSPRLSPDGSWFFGDLGADAPSALTLDLTTGTTQRVDGLGTDAGTALGGSALYGWLLDPTGAVIRATTRTGTKAVLTIDWPDGAVTSGEMFDVLGLWVGAAT